MNRNIRIKIENSIILLSVLASFGLLVSSFMPSLQVSSAVSLYFEMGKMVQRAFSMVLLAVSLQLLRRKHTAWCIAVFILLLNFFRGFSGLRHPHHLLLMVGNALLLAAFFYFREDFCCPSSRHSKKGAAVLLLLSLTGTAVNAGLSYHYTKMGVLGNGGSLLESFLSGAGTMVGMGSGLPESLGASKLEFIIFWFSWGCVLAAVLYAARPWIDIKGSGASDLAHARTLLNLYRQNPCSYLALEAVKNISTFYSQVLYLFDHHQ